MNSQTTNTLKQPTQSSRQRLKKIVEARRGTLVPGAFNALSARGGTVFMIGLLDAGDVRTNLTAITFKALRVQGNNTGSVQDLQEAIDVIRARKLVPEVWRTYAIEDLPSAYKVQESGTQFGKIVVGLEF